MAMADADGGLYDKVLVYIVYGNDPAYYQGAVVSVLTFLASWQGKAPLVVVLAEQIHWFEGLPVRVLPLSAVQKDTWSMQGRYAFRIKNRGLAFIIDTLLAEQSIAPQSKILFCDADTFFPQTAAPLYALIDERHAVMYLREARIGEKKRLHGYLRDLQDKALAVSPTFTYHINPRSYMWGSLLIGITADKRTLLDEADALMLAMLEHCSERTIEQFSLAETLSRHMTLREGKRWVRHYSRPNQKDWVLPQLARFSECARGKTFAQQTALVRQIRFTRPLWLVIRQKLAGSRWES